MTTKPPRISGQIPAGYSGQIFYRLSNYVKPNPPSKVLFDFIKFPGRNTMGINAISYLCHRDAIIYTDYLDEHGKVKEVWNTPIQAEAKSNYQEDWPEFSLHNMTLISERVKNVIEKFESENHAFVAIDVGLQSGKLLRAFVMVRGVAIDAVDYLASGIVPSKVYPGGKASWVATNALPRDEFCYLSREKVESRNHFWDENLGHVWSQRIVAELGDVLPREYVFVPMGVTG
jgi:hypothetical protein